MNSPSAAIRRVLIPVRSVIHASLVSIIPSRSALLRTRSGAYAPSALIPARKALTTHSRCGLAYYPF